MRRGEARRGERERERESPPASGSFGSKERRVDVGGWMDGRMTVEAPGSRGAGQERRRKPLAELSKEKEEVVERSKKA